VQKCAQHGFNVGASIYGVYVALGITEAGCKSLLKEIGGKHEALLLFNF